jgi:hypothetical protein
MLIKLSLCNNPNKLVVLNIAMTQSTEMYREGSTFKLAAYYSDGTPGMLYDITENCYNRLLHKLEMVS